MASYDHIKEIITGEFIVIIFKNSKCNQLRFYPIITIVNESCFFFCLIFMRISFLSLLYVQ